MSLSRTTRPVRARLCLVACFAVGILFFAFEPELQLWPSRLDRLPGINGKSNIALDSSNDPQVLLARADHFYWLNNGFRAAPLYARAEQLFSQQGDARNEIHAKVGRMRSEGETMSFVELSLLLERELKKPIVEHDKPLSLWCLAAKGYTDIEIDHHAAKLDWQKAQEIANELGESGWANRAAGELGLIAFLDGNAGRAARLLGAALLKTMSSGDIGGQIRFLDLIGDGFEEVNRHAEALRFFERAIKLADKDKDSGFPFMAYEGKAQALAALGKEDQAKALLQDVLAKARSEQREGHQAELLTLLGGLAARAGDIKQADVYLKEAGRLASRVHFFRLYADVMFELSSLDRDSGDVEAAEAHATEGLVASQRVGDRYYVPRNLTMLADLKASHGAVQEASALYSHAEDVIEGMLVSVNEHYWDTSVASSMSDTYLHHFELLNQSGDITGAFKILERIRGRTIASALEDRSALQTTESEQTAALETDVASAQLRLMQTNDGIQRQQLLDQLLELERRLGLSWMEGTPAARRLPLQPASLRRIEGDLDSGELLVEYVLDHPIAFCIAVSRSGARIQALPAEPKQIELMVQKYLAEVRQKKDAIEPSRQLFKVLVALIPGARGATSLIIAPDGLLNLLPFESLRDDQDQLLLKTHTISYTPSATILDWLRRNRGLPTAPRPLLAVGDVAYENQGGAGRDLPPPSTVLARMERSFAELSGAPLYDLPQTRKEVQEIAGFAGPNAVLLLGKDATEAAFKREPLDQFRALHLAVHGFADTQYPERSALILAPDPKRGEDGLLQVREIMRLRLNAQLTTLSACESGVGKLEGQEGVSNLVEAFLVAGSKSVVASLWSVDDRSTRMLMADFYGRLARREPSASALRNAKLDLLDKVGDLSPYYWAAFIGVGETSSPVQVR